jgi:hypothetical protein
MLLVLLVVAVVALPTLHCPEHLSLLGSFSGESALFFALGIGLRQTAGCLAEQHPLEVSHRMQLDLLV